MSLKKIDYGMDTAVNCPAEIRYSHIEDSTLVYLLLVGNIPALNANGISRENHIAYSILIAMTSEDECETKFIYDITSDGQAAKKLFSLIWQHKVTPCTLQDVVEDYICA